WLAAVFGGDGRIEEHAAGSETAKELLLMVISVMVAATGAGLAYLMYYRRSIAPETFSELAGGAPYRVVLNKYYVDELYDRVFVRGVLLLSRMAAWFDQHVIDGIVNLSAVSVREISRLGGFLDFLVVDGAVNAVANATYPVGGGGAENSDGCDQRVPLRRGARRAGWRLPLVVLGIGVLREREEYDGTLAAHVDGLHAADRGGRRPLPAVGGEGRDPLDGDGVHGAAGAAVGLAAVALRAERGVPVRAEGGMDPRLPHPVLRRRRRPERHDGRPDGAPLLPLHDRVVRHREGAQGLLRALPAPRDRHARYLRRPRLLPLLRL